ncbi:hypothetical protein DNTS_014254 [Danionella cerebrum]|uniref:Ig-like domain-containing protein n=1 Tax=Danionella cerebrum TaxID=2873325 RepID=A0A553QTX8_9TELE|nr:hypothetical protein DNTS_014254 [Danionella translucida]
MAFAAIIKKKFLNVQHSIGLRMRSIQQQRIRLEEPDGGESCTEFYLNNAAPLCVLLIVCEGEPAAALASSPRSMNVQHSELLSRTQTQNIAREKPVAARSAAVKPTNGSCAETSFRVRWKKQQRQNLKGKVERQLPFEPQPPPPPITPLVRVWRVAFCMRRDPTPDDAPLLSSQQLPNPDHPSIRNPPCICRMHRTDLLHVMNIGCEFVLLLVRLCSPPRPHRVLPLLGWRLSRGGINCPLIAPLSVQLLPKAEKRSGSFSDLPKRKLSFRRALFRLLPVFAVCLATVTVSVIPRKEVLRGETIRLPCNYTTSAAASTIVVQWFIELADGSRKQVAFKSSQGLDAGTVSERYTIGNDMSLSITQVTADDHKKFICQVTAGAVGTSDAATQVKVFCESGRDRKHLHDRSVAASAVFALQWIVTYLGFKGGEENRWFGGPNHKRPLLSGVKFCTNCIRHMSISRHEGMSLHAESDSRANARVEVELIRTWVLVWKDEQQEESYALKLSFIRVLGLPRDPLFLQRASPAVCEGHFMRSRTTVSVMEGVGCLGPVPLCVWEESSVKSRSGSARVSDGCNNCEREQREWETMIGALRRRELPPMTAGALKLCAAPEKPVVEGNNQNIFVSHKTSPPSEVGKCISRNGHPEPRIIWFKDDTPLPEEKKTTEKTYMLPFLVKEASGLYTMTSTLYMQLIKADAKSVFHCTVEYSMPNNQIKQESSDRFNLSLHYSAENVFFKVKTQGPIKEGDDVEMLCETDGNPQPEFDFMKDENQLTGSRGTLTVKGVSRSDAGIYQCEALDFDAVDVELTKNVNLNVHYIDAMSVTPSGALNASRGDSDSKVLSNNGGLRIESVTLSDGGVYVCAGDVPSVPGLKKQANVILTVIGHPEIDAPVHGSVDKEGRMVSLNCSALGYPAPQFIWKPSGKESVTVSGTRVISTVTLEATAAVLKDGVICEAYNTLGRDSKNFKVSIKQAEKQQGGSSSVVIAVVVCVLLLLVLVALLFFLNKKGKLNCGKKDTKEVASGGAKDNIVVEMKSSEKSKEEAGLLKPADQGVEYTRVVVLNVGMVFLRDAALKRTVQHPTDICSELTPSAKTKLRETLDVWWNHLISCVLH